MAAPKEVMPKADIRDYLAAERTLLAWIRTGLALMGFGFVVARFGLFLQELQATQHFSTAQTYGLSLWFGTALIAAGVFVNVFAGWHHTRLVHELDGGESTASHPASMAVMLALFLALVGLGMAIYLISLRGSTQQKSATGPEASMSAATDKGIVTIVSHHSVDETVEKLKGLLEAKGVMLFAVVDHSGGAEKAGLKMRPTKLLIFGNPKSGTPLMVAAPSSAIDLPLKILVWEDGQGKAWISYNSLAYLQQRHGLPQELLPNIAAVEKLASLAAE